MQFDMKYWPVVVAFLTIFALGARADAQITSHDGKIKTIEGTVIRWTDRLARMEENDAAQIKALERIEKKLDNLD